MDYWIIDSNDLFKNSESFSNRNTAVLLRDARLFCCDLHLELLLLTKSSKNSQQWQYCTKMYINYLFELLYRGFQGKLHSLGHVMLLNYAML